MQVLKRIGLLGGTFDPVHYGHLRTALEIKNALKLDELRLIPCAEPVHRAATIASAEQRLLLLKMALTEFPEMQVDDSEIRRGGKSWTVDTVKDFAEQEPAASFFLLLGADAYAGFTDWHQWSIILQLANLIVMRRPGYQINRKSASGKLLEQHEVKSISDLADLKAGGILIYDVMPSAISSSEIRQRLREQKPVDHFLPPAVLKGIKDFSLYQ